MTSNERIRYFDILFPLKAGGAYTYSFSTNLKLKQIIGRRVLAELKNKIITGLVIGESNPLDNINYKSIITLIDDDQIISDELLELTKWISEYYLTDFGVTLASVLPSFMFDKVDIIYSRKSKFNTNNNLEDYSIDEKMILFMFDGKETISKSELFSSKDPNYIHSVNSLIEKGIIESNVVHKKTTKPKYTNTVKITKKGKEFYLTNSGKLEKPSSAFILLDFLYKNGEILRKSDLKYRQNISPYGIQKARELEFIEISEMEEDRIPSLLFIENRIKQKQICFTDEQMIAIKEINMKINEGKFSSILLHGVTGSGKTEIYIEAVKRTLALGKSAIILIPEIVLTPQTVMRFRTVFENRIAVLHSKLSDGEKFDSWRRIAEGKYDVVIGARSAVFAPLKKPGLIIVDEEQEKSYKQNDSMPCYHARNVAIMRMKINNGVCILGSATPSLESYDNGNSGKFRNIRLTKRAPGADLPTTTFIKLSRENYGSIFHPTTIGKINGTLEDGRKVLIFHNRRGYASYQICNNCGYIELCKNCAVSLNYHLKSNELICHQCGFVKKGKSNCQKCGSTNVIFKGIGTEQIEEEIKRLFPDKGIIRMDLDTTRGKDAHDNLLTKFNSKDYHFLLGTQMIAKGLDIEEITLVVIVNADSELIFPDFRSDENAFQLFTQVSGRAGRGKFNGEVLIQSYDPENKTLLFASTQNYDDFATNELVSRKLLKYPPYSKLIKIMLTSSNYDRLNTYSVKLYEKLIVYSKEIYVYYPVDSLISKVNNMFKRQILVKSISETDPNGKVMREVVKKIVNEEKASYDIRLKIDVDPEQII
ncbi:MAG: primosomal protein N' [Candidatus Delongbacteria bacterium]|nr:primosomal protein N' [Candidatus Delongbacteria bacterium]MBN2836792.1 primosomal protein N' [Candidatus Delongbacteria bacterium]